MEYLDLDHLHVNHANHLLLDHAYLVYVAILSIHLVTTYLHPNSNSNTVDNPHLREDLVHREDLPCK